MKRLPSPFMYMLWWLRMYNTACNIAVQIMPYARVRQLVKLDIITKPMEEGESFTVFQRKAPLQMQQLMGSMPDICLDAAIANESLRTKIAPSVYLKSL